MEAHLNPDRFFDPDEAVRRTARDLFLESQALPLICPHGHVEPGLFADDIGLGDPLRLLVLPDHYLVRMLYSRGVSIESFAVLDIGAPEYETAARRAWQVFADHVHLFWATPSHAWLRYQLHEVFGVGRSLTSESAQTVYDEVVERASSPEFRPRALFDRFNIEVLATTDGAADPLTEHERIAASGWKGRVVPTFRPDAVFRIADPAWPVEIDALERASGVSIEAYDDFVRAIEDRRAYFRARGATSSDHGVLEPFTERVPASELEVLFQRALNGSADTVDQRRFEGHMLIEMARMSVEDGLVMQVHSGAMRDHNPLLFEQYGSDRGADIPIATEYTRNLKPLLDEFGNDSRLTLVLFTLDESAYSRELAPIAGHYPAVRLGPPWWFHDSIEGMRRYFERTIETAGVYNTVGFNDDSRTFCSVPARHDLARRVTCNWLARLVARHIVGRTEAGAMMRALCYELPKEAYRLD